MMGLCHEVCKTWIYIHSTHVHLHKHSASQDICVYLNLYIPTHMLICMYILCIYRHDGALSCGVRQTFVVNSKHHTSCKGHLLQKILRLAKDFVFVVNPNRTRSFSETGFWPLYPSFVWFVSLSRTKRVFWLVPEHAPGPSSQVLPSCRVRHPCYSKKLFVRSIVYMCMCNSILYILVLYILPCRSPAA